MATINYAQKEISCKIVYYGPGLGGKTTNLQFIHQTLPEVNRGELVSLATQQDRTLFFDFLPMDLGVIKGFNTKFHLYTVPGQVYYNATRKLVLRGVDGIVFVADSQRDRMEENIKSLHNLEENLCEYNYDLKTTPWVMQYNKRDMPNACPIEELETALNPDKAPYFEAVAVTGEGVKQTLKAISSLVLNKLKTVAEEPEHKKTSLSTLAEQQTAQPPAENQEEKSEFPQKSALFRERKKDAGELFMDSDPLEADLPMKRPMTFYWRGVKIGSADLTLSRSDKSGTKILYELKGAIIILAFIRRMLDVKLLLRGKQRKTVNKIEKELIFLTDLPESRPPLADPFCVWVDEKDKSLFISYASRFGPVQLSPPGAPPIA